MTAKSLLQLRVDVRDRAHVSAKDPRFNDNVVNRSIQQAYGEVASMMPGGWWFQRMELEQAGNGAAVLPITNTVTGGYVENVGYVYASTDGDYWVPINRRTRTDSIRAGGGVMAPVGIPESWGVEYVGSDGAGNQRQLAFVFDPPIAASTTVRFGVVLGPADFVNDADFMVGLPLQFTGAVIERASARLIRIRREVGNLTTRRRYVTAATLCDTAFEGWMRALKAFFGKPYGGAGYGATHWRS